MQKQSACIILIKTHFCIISNVSWYIETVKGKGGVSVQKIHSVSVRTIAEFALEKGDLIVLTGGVINGKSGNTNTIKVEEI